ncbi:putative DD41D transposase [Trichonephila clavipes]|nr:putative DD41D transposase [Trichonephila clavipes]
MFNNFRGSWSIHAPDSLVLEIMNLLNRKKLLISEKESLPVLTCGPSQNFYRLTEVSQSVNLIQRIIVERSFVARATIDLLKDAFGDHLISRFGPVNWPPRSCDLTQLNYFLWAYVKSLVYADKPQTLDHLEDNIRRYIADIRPQMLEKVIENVTSRLDYIRASRGSHMPEIIF